MILVWFNLDHGNCKNDFPALGLSLTLYYSALGILLFSTIYLFIISIDSWIPTFSMVYNSLLYLIIPLFQLSQN